MQTIWSLSFRDVCRRAIILDICELLSSTFKHDDSLNSIYYRSISTANVHVCIQYIMSSFRNYFPGLADRQSGSMLPSRSLNVWRIALGQRGQPQELVIVDEFNASWTTSSDSEFKRCRLSRVQTIHLASDVCPPGNV